MDWKSNKIQNFIANYADIFQNLFIFNRQNIKLKWNDVTHSVMSAFHSFSKFLQVSYPDMLSFRLPLISNILENPCVI